MSLLLCHCCCCPPPIDFLISTFLCTGCNNQRVASSLTFFPPRLEAKAWADNAISVGSGGLVSTKDEVYSKRGMARHVNNVGEDGFANTGFYKIFKVANTLTSPAISNDEENNNKSSADIYRMLVHPYIQDKSQQSKSLIVYPSPISRGDSKLIKTINFTILIESNTINRRNKKHTLVATVFLPLDMLNSSSTSEEKRNIIIHSHGNATDLGPMTTRYTSISQSSSSSTTKGNIVIAYDYTGYGESEGDIFVLPSSKKEDGANSPGREGPQVRGEMGDDNDSGLPSNNNNTVVQPVSNSGNSKNEFSKDDFPMCTEKQTYQDIQAVYEYSTSALFSTVCFKVLRFYDQNKEKGNNDFINDFIEPKVILYGQSIGSGPR